MQNSLNFMFSNTSLFEDKNMQQIRRITANKKSTYEISHKTSTRDTSSSHNPARRRECPHSMDKPSLKALPTNSKFSTTVKPFRKIYPVKMVKV